MLSGSGAGLVPRNCASAAAVQKSVFFLLSSRDNNLQNPSRRAGACWQCEGGAPAHKLVKEV